MIALPTPTRGPQRPVHILVYLHLMMTLFPHNLPITLPIIPFDLKLRPLSWTRSHSDLRDWEEGEWWLKQRGKDYVKSRNRLERIDLHGCYKTKTTNRKRKFHEFWRGVNFRRRREGATVYFQSFCWDLLFYHSFLSAMYLRSRVCSSTWDVSGP